MNTWINQLSNNTSRLFEQYQFWNFDLYKTIYARFWSENIINKIYRVACISSTIKEQTLPMLEILSEEISSVYELGLQASTRAVKGTHKLAVTLLCHCHPNLCLESSLMCLMAWGTSTWMSNRSAQHRGLKYQTVMRPPPPTSICSSATFPSQFTAPPFTQFLRPWILESSLSLIHPSLQPLLAPPSSHILNTALSHLVYRNSVPTGFLSSRPIPLHISPQ